MGYDIGPYDPCPCGSGKKYKFCCAEKAKAVRHGKFPIGTIAYYGPDDKTTTKIAAGVILRDGAEPIIERFVGTDVTTSEKVAGRIKQFFAKHGVKSVTMTSGNMGCPHEEGKDFPRGRECPFCPFWEGKQGIVPLDADEDPAWDETDDENDVDELQRDSGLEVLDPKSLEVVQEELRVRDREGGRESGEAYERFEELVGGEDVEFEDAVARAFSLLIAKLVLPIEVTGIEDFQWEERYVIGGWSDKEWRQLRKTQPSYDDRYQLLKIDPEKQSEWMMHEEDLGAVVRRISDGKEFVLGLSELEAVDEGSESGQLLNDYAVWFVNRRFYA